MATRNPRAGDDPRQNPRKKRARGAPDDDVLKQMIVDKVTERVQAKVNEKLARKLGPDAPDMLDLWTRHDPGARRPRYTREDIAEAAVHIADLEGIDALSMRCLAVELGAGTMTLYHYVRTKDELLALVTDQVMGEIVVAEDRLPADDWRAAMTAIAQSSRAVLERHPWIFDIVDDPTAGPNGVRHFDQSMQAVASMPGTMADKLDVIFAVDEYVFGHCLHRRQDLETGQSPIADAAMREYVGGLVAAGGYPALEALVAEHGLEEMWDVIEQHERDEGRFDRNLARLLDGIAATLPS